MTTGFGRHLPAFGPAVARLSLTEALRAGLGAGVGLFLTGLMAAALHVPSFLIAPLGATAFLLFAVPNSPLAQPYAAVVGNSLSALTALCVIRLIADPHLAAAVAVTFAVLVMAATRALHPPGGAVALLVALQTRPGTPAGFDFALAPVLLDTVMLVAAAIVWNSATGRKYPFRQPPVTGPHGTSDPAPERRLGLSPDDLLQLLQRLNLSANIGAEDLARLIGQAEAEATARHLGGLKAADIMSRDLLTVSPGDHPLKLTAIFRAHGFKTLPVVAADGHYLGVLSQADLLGISDESDNADHLMSTAFATARPDTPVATLLALLADGAQQAVPVLNGVQLVGLVTRTDMIGALVTALAT